MSRTAAIDAVTAVFQHDGEVLLLQQLESLDRFAGHHLFPAGSVVAVDEVGEALAAYPDIEPRFIRALVREAAAYLSFDLGEGIRRGTASMVRLGASVTPLPLQPRYNARFFRIDLSERPALVPDPKIFEGGEWASPAEWLRRFNAGRVLLPPSVRSALEGLASGVVPIPGLHPIPLTDAIAQSESVIGVHQFWVRSNTLPPALHTNCFLIGDANAERVLVDPSPNSTVELERLCAQARRIGFHAVMLTHHHPDHRQFADEIARRFQVPIWMSADTQRRIRAAQPRFLEGLRQRLLREGDVVTAWLGQPVRVLEVPGHDEGQLALMPDDRAWCIVGDLIQGIGSVVIAPPEGDMRKYFASLRRIIELKPRAIFPSHGLALGGVYYLRKTLHHREQREQQVRALFAAGRSVDEMLHIIYAGVDPRLLRLAQANIESHLAKLKSDGTIAAPVIWRL